MIHTRWYRQSVALQTLPAVEGKAVGQGHRLVRVVAGRAAESPLGPVTVTGAEALAGDVRLLVADLDNNGGLDLILTPVGEAAGSGKTAAVPMIWLADEKSARVSTVSKKGLRRRIISPFARLSNRECR